MSTGFSSTTIDEIEVLDIPEPAPYILDDCMLALRLGYTPKAMWFFILERDSQYTVHHIPKKAGGLRVIHAPTDPIKLFLHRVHVHILTPLHDQLGEHVTAYRSGRSVKEAAEQHIHPCAICDESLAQHKTAPDHPCPRCGAYIHMDLKNFFPSTKPAWIRSYFKSLGYSHYVSNLLSSIMTVNTIPKKVRGRWESRTGVPQGAPTSAAICNLVANHFFDQKIIRYLEVKTKEEGLSPAYAWRYSRYADDLTITAGHEYPKEVKQKIVKDVTELIEETGYRVNKSKTRYPHAHRQKKMLGVTFNQKTNINRQEYERMRAITHNCLVHGLESQLDAAGKETVKDLTLWLRGKINFINQLNPHRGGRLIAELETAITTHGATPDAS